VWWFIEQTRHSVDLCLGSLRKILLQQAIGVLIGSTRRKMVERLACEEAS
jgi:hypothetical protein